MRHDSAKRSKETEERLRTAERERANKQRRQADPGAGTSDTAEGGGQEFGR